MSWQDAHEYQMDLWKFWKLPIAKRFAQGFAEITVESEQEIRPGWGITGEGPEADQRLVTNMILAQERVLYAAEPVWVDPDMLTLTENAFTKFKPEPLVEQDIIVRQAFVLFPRAVHFTDLNGKDFPVRAMSWAPAMIDAPRDSLDPSAKQGIILAAYMHWDDDPLGEDFPKTSAYKEARNYTPLSLAHITTWAYGMDWFLKSIPEAARGPTGSNAAIDCQRFAQVLMRLMSQNIVTRTRSKPARPSVKRARKVKFPDSKYVTVIELRRPKSPYGKEAGHVPKVVDWSHRWLVSGFWRKQPYPSEGVHRQIWINPYVKGPADKPLIVRSMRAYEFKR